MGLYQNLVILLSQQGFCSTNLEEQKPKALIQRFTLIFPPLD